MIAAIAIANQCAIATRDTSPFKTMGVVEVIDPWTGETWKRRDYEPHVNISLRMLA